MLLKELKYKKSTVLLIAIAHAIVSAFFWLWMGVVALGLGFKDKEKWTAWDSIQETVVPPVALSLTVPGRFITFQDPLGFGLIIPWLLNSILWSLVIVFLYTWYKSCKKAT